MEILPAESRAAVKKGDFVLRLKSENQVAELTDPEISSKARAVGGRGPRSGETIEAVVHSLGATRMNRHPVYRVVWVAVNVLLVVAIAAFVCGSMWEYSTRQYLRGFSDAVVPFDASPVQKVEAILTWMAHGPARRVATDSGELTTREPRESLNYSQLLTVCGGATNAFVNLAISSRLQARRLLLLDSHRATTHVVAEVWMDNEWVVVDPSFHFIARDESGHFLTREDMEDQAVLQKVTAGLPGYLPTYNYSTTAHVHITRLPVLGSSLRTFLSWVWPKWDDSVDWTLLLERDSFLFLVISLLALVFLFITRQILGFYGERRLGVGRRHWSRQIWQAGVLIFGNSR